MTMLSFIAAIFCTGTSWDGALQRLASDTAGFRRILSSPGAPVHAANRWLAENHLLGESDEKGQPLKDGLWVPGVQPCMASVEGKPRGIVIRMHAVSLHRNSEDDILALFRPEGKKLRAWCISNTDEMSIEHAAMTSHDLLLSGKLFWFSNSPRATVAAFRLKNGEWQPNGRLISERESYEVVKPRLSGASLSLRPGKVHSREYPPNLDACHATSNYSFLEQWSFREGKLRADWIVKCETPFNRLDSLYGYLTDGDGKMVRKYCASEAVFRRVMSLQRLTESGPPSIVYPSQYSPEYKTEIRLCSTERSIIGLRNVGVYFCFVRRNGHWLVGHLEKLEE
jgi:hypothetical protein